MSTTKEYKVFVDEKTELTSPTGNEFVIVKIGGNLYKIKLQKIADLSTGGGSGGSQNLQQVTDIGAITTNPIEVTELLLTDPDLGVIRRFYNELGIIGVKDGMDAIQWFFSNGQLQIFKDGVFALGLTAPDSGSADVKYPATTSQELVAYQSWVSSLGYLLASTASTTYQAILTDTNFGSFINSLTDKTTPIDADSVSIVDSADSNKQKKVSLTNFKAFLKTYFDTLYGGGSTILKETITTDKTLTSSTSQQDVFNNAINVVTGETYTFRMNLEMENLSSTNGNIQLAFDGGTCVFDWISYNAIGSKGNLLTQANTATVLTVDTSASTALNSFNTGAVAKFMIMGMIKITTGGTLYPQVKMSIAATSTIKKGTFIRLET